MLAVRVPQVGTRDLNQWFFRITRYADALLEGADRSSISGRSRC